jgi:pimeloyl-ACP methyl ester carboxylesterase
MLRVIAVLLLSSLLGAESAPFQGRKLHYEGYGQGKETLVLIHGWSCDAGFWAANVPALAARYRVLALDLPGHGRSDTGGTYTMEEFGDAVFAVMDAAGVRKAILVGHSMGGAVMLACARRQPTRVKAIVAVDAGFLDSASAGTSRDFGSRFEGPQGAETREKMVKAMFTPATPEAVQAQVLKTMMGTPQAVAVGAMKGLFAPSFWKDDVIVVPFLEIGAASSAWLTEDGLRKRFPKAQLKKIEGTGHFLMMEKPEAFNRILLDWLKGQEFP